MKKIAITLGSPTPVTTSITDRVKSFEDACAILGIIGEVFEASLHDTLGADAAAVEAHLKLMVIAKALNEGWTPDWSDEDQYKHYPYFNMEKGFELFIVVYLYSYSDVSSRLCFKSEALAEYAAKQFLELYKQYFVIAK